MKSIYWISLVITAATIVIFVTRKRSRKQVAAAPLPSPVETPLRERVKAIEGQYLDRYVGYHLHKLCLRLFLDEEVARPVLAPYPSNREPVVEWGPEMIAMTAEEVERLGPTVFAHVKGQGVYATNMDWYGLFQKHLSEKAFAIAKHRVESHLQTRGKSEALETLRSFESL